MRLAGKESLRLALKRGVSRYGFALGTVLLAALLQKELWANLPPSPQLFFYPAVLLIARTVGLGPALFGVALSCPLLALWFHPPYGALEVGRIDDLLDLALFAAMATILSVLIERLRSSEAKARSAIEAAPFPTLLLDARGRIHYANPALTKAIRVPFAAIEGKGFSTLLHEDDAGELARILEALALPGALPGPLRARLLRGEASALDIEGQISSVAVTSAGGYLVQFLDVTARNAADAELRGIEELRKQWNAVVAHDLRQPLNAILLRAERLALGSAKSPLADLQAIARATQRASGMVHDLLDASRLEARQLSLSPKEVDVSEVVAHRVELLQSEMPEHPIDLVIREEHLSAWLDPDRLVQILENLLSNAVKYGREKSPIRVEVAGQANAASIAITNHGQGILKEDMPHLFQRFHRAGRDLRSGKKGVGLGLYITRELVVAQGGEISCESEPGDRTTFFVTFPRHAAPPPS